MKVLVCAGLVTILLGGCKGEQKPASKPAESEDEESGAESDGEDEETPPSSGEKLGGAMATKTKILKKALENRKRSKTLGKMVNWRKLAAFLPAEFGAFKSSQKARGKNFKMGKLETASAKRYYLAGKKDLTVELNDLSVNPMLRASIKVARKMKLEMPGGYMEHGLRVGGNPAIRGWGKNEEKKLGVGMLRVLVGGRYLVQLKLVGAEDPDEVIKVFEQLDLAKLPALKAEKDGR